MLRKSTAANAEMNLPPPEEPLLLACRRKFLPELAARRGLTRYGASQIGSRVMMLMAALLGATVILWEMGAMPIFTAG